MGRKRGHLSTDPGTPTVEGCFGRCYFSFSSGLWLHCRLSHLPWFWRKSLSRKAGDALEGAWVGIWRCTELYRIWWAEGSVKDRRNNLLQTSISRPRVSDNVQGNLMCDCKHVARALCSSSWCESPTELLTSVVATGPVWLFSLLPPSLPSPTEPYHGHTVPTSNHRGGENPVCLTLYPNTLTLILKALRHWESGKLLWSCKCHLEEGHLDPLGLLPASSGVS